MPGPRELQSRFERLDALMEARDLLTLPVATITRRKRVEPPSITDDDFEQKLELFEQATRRRRGRPRKESQDER